MIELRGICKYYDDKVAVDRVDLDVARGSVFGLIGPNGAGKTTTLRMLSTLAKPDAGSIRIDGCDAIEDVGSVRGTIGYMPDQFGAFRGLGCEEYLRFFGRCHGIRGAELKSRVNEVLELTELQQVRDESTAALSTGMRQRLSLAKTLLHDPKVLFLDEPASGLDPRARIEIRMMLRELGRMGKTIVISSHILSDLEEICSEVGLIEQGRLVWCGALDEIEAARSDVVRCFVEVAEESVERAVQRLAQVAGVVVRERHRRRLELELEERIGNRVLQVLIEGEVEVLAFEVQRARLEDLFLERTHGIVS